VFHQKPRSKVPLQLSSMRSTANCVATNWDAARPTVSRFSGALNVWRKFIKDIVSPAGNGEAVSPASTIFGSTAEVADNDSQTHYQLFQSTKRRRCGDTSENANVKSACVRSHDLWEFGENDEGDMAIPSIQKGCQASFSGFRHRCTAPPTMPSLKH
jgi:hypothetical protein